MKLYHVLFSESWHLVWPTGCRDFTILFELIFYSSTLGVVLILAVLWDSQLQIAKGYIRMI